MWKQRLVAACSLISLRFIAALIAVCLTNCAAPSSSIGTAGIESVHIEKGVTTERDLIAQLGQPQGHGLDAKGRRLLTWNRIDAATTAKASIPVAGPFLPGSGVVHKRQLAVSFDSRGKVAESKLTDEAHRANIVGETD